MTFHSTAHYFDVTDDITRYYAPFTVPLVIMTSFTVLLVIMTSLGALLVYIMSLTTTIIIMTSLTAPLFQVNHCIISLIWRHSQNCSSISRQTLYNSLLWRRSHYCSLILHHSWLELIIMTVLIQLVNDGGQCLLLY